MNPLVRPNTAGAPSVVMEISLKSGSFVSLTNPMKALKISSPLVCPYNGKTVSSSSLALMSSKTILMKTQLCHIHHISRLVKLEGNHSQVSILLAPANRRLRCLRAGERTTLERNISLWLTLLEDGSNRWVTFTAKRSSSSTDRYQSTPEQSSDQNTGLN